ncbi:molybdopterin-dependent oxidoreductase [Thermorudis peleae]|uniref:molybdopterin-dependent oxidoreductase n=1 Tax=Thermorudis peleae TaxID=1382356 RepID=UPI00068E4445|nr:molybdopterin-dependent oxidoreductase [Thermorudis peleae]
MALKTEQRLVTVTINGQQYTVPEGMTILEACRMVGIEVPNMCYQPLLRPWGSCRICTVEILGRRGGLVESCAAQVRDGMEIATNSPACEEARRFVLEMYLIDHALDCPTCDKSGECYLQDNTYFHNVRPSPYDRPKIARPYKHFSDVIDYKWERCIICARCTRVCDEVIGVTAIEILNRGLEAEVSPAWGIDLRDTTCTSCGMCIAVCPVGALTDRKFAHHPWELDTTETICGFCDVGCTLNVEHNRGLVRRVTHLWERGLNYGYTCVRGKWGYEHVQHPDRLEQAYRRQGDALVPVSLDEALDFAAEQLRHYQGNTFAALASQDATNEELYALQLFTRAVMGSNNIDRLATPAQRAVEQALLDSFGLPVNTNSVQELFTDTACALVVGPSIGEHAPVASYWLYWSRNTREAKTIVISHDHYPLCDRAEVWIRASRGSEAAILHAMARVIVEEGWAAPVLDNESFRAWQNAIRRIDVAAVAAQTGVSVELIRKAAELYATGGVGAAAQRPDGGYPPSAIFHTLAHEQNPADVYAATIALHNLALLTNNVGRPGAGVVAFRGPANAQGALDMGCHPALYPGYQPVADPTTRHAFAVAWLGRWNQQAPRLNGFAPLATLPEAPGYGLAELTQAIQRGEIRALWLVGSSHTFAKPLDASFLAALEQLEFLMVEDCFPSELTERAHLILPGAMFLEKDGTYTSADRFVQRLRIAVNPPGDAHSTLWYVQAIAQRLGYTIAVTHPGQLFQEIAHLAPIYRGISYPRLERGPLPWPLHDAVSAGDAVVFLGPNVPGGKWGIWLQQAAFGAASALRFDDGLARERLRFVVPAI